MLSSELSVTRLSRLSFQNSFSFFQLPEELIAHILCDWLADARDLACLDIAACNYDKQAILHRRLKNCLITSLVVPEHPSEAERCFQWLRTRKVSILSLNSCDINIFAQYFHILHLKPPVSILATLQSIELTGRCQPFQEENALQMLRLLQLTAPNLSHIRTYLAPYHSSSKSRAVSMFTGSSFSPSSPSKENFSFHSTFLLTLLQGKKNDNKGFLTSIDMSLCLQQDRHIFQTFFSLHSPFLRSLILRDVFLYDRDIVALLQQLPLLETFHLFRQDNMPYGGSLPPRDTWTSPTNRIQEGNKSPILTLSLTKLKELVLSQPDATSTSSSSRNIPCFATSSTMHRASNVLSAFLLHYAPNLQKIVIRDHFVTETMYDVLMTQTVRYNVRYLTLRGCISLSIPRKVHIESSMAVEECMKLVFPTLKYVELKDGSAETLTSILIHLCTASLLPTFEEISQENNNNMIDSKSTKLTHLILSVSPTLRTLQLVPLFPSYSLMENYFTATIKASLTSLHISFIGLDAYSWCIIFFEMPQLMSLQWDGYSAIEFDAALSALEEYCHIQNNSRNTIDTYSTNNNNTSYNVNTNNNDTHYINDATNTHLDTNDHSTNDKNHSCHSLRGLRYLCLEARPGTPIDSDDSRRLLTFLSGNFSNHSHSLRHLSLHRFVFADVDLCDCLLQQFPRLEILDVNLSCDAWTLEYPVDPKRSLISRLRYVHFSCGNRIAVHGLCAFIESLLSSALIEVTCWQCTQLTDALSTIKDIEKRFYDQNNENDDISDEWKLLEMGQQLQFLGGRLIIDDQVVPSYRYFGQKRVEMRHRQLLIDDDVDIS